MNQLNFQIAGISKVDSLDKGGQTGINLSSQLTSNNNKIQPTPVEQPQLTEGPALQYKYYYPTLQ